LLKPWKYIAPTELDERIFAALVPPDHYLRAVKAVLDFAPLRAEMADAYPATTGRPAAEPLLLLGLEYLQYHYNLSDRQVVALAQVNVAFRFFLDLSLDSGLPHPSLLSYFRQRLGPQRHQQLFNAVVAQAREHGLVKDRLRLKDATHVIANIAIPSTLRLLAQTRQHLLDAAEAFLPEWVAEHRQLALAIRATTADLDDNERLLQRVTHLRTVTAHLDLMVDDWSAAAVAETVEQARLRQALALAHKVLADREPQAADKVLSVHDPDARRGKHGDFFEGYLLDVAMDADSQLITGLDVLAGNGDEGANAAALIRHEEQTHGNDVQALSQDGAGYRGETLRELTAPEGLALEVFVPPTEQLASGKFTPEQFTLSEDGKTLTCPAGQSTTWRQPVVNGVSFIFKASACGDCPLRQQCLSRPSGQRRAVVKNDYEAEYRAAQQQAKTAAYAEVRRQHPAIERKLNEVVRWHRARRARYRGRGRVQTQGWLTALVVNVKRMVKLLVGANSASEGPVRAVAAATGW
jgi:transposase